MVRISQALALTVLLVVMGVGLGLAGVAVAQEPERVGETGEGRDPGAVAEQASQAESTVSAEVESAEVESSEVESVEVEPSEAAPSEAAESTSSEAASSEATDSGLFGLDLGGVQIEQIRADGTVESLVIPTGLILVPGGLLVVGQGTQAEHEAAWGALAPGTIYLGTSLADAESSLLRPLAGARYRLLAEDGTLLDPPVGWVPAIAVRLGRTYRRQVISRPVFAGEGVDQADPGIYSGRREGSGLLIISEIAGPGEAAQLSFVELFWDAAEAPDISPVE